MGIRYRLNCLLLIESGHRWKLIWIPLNRATVSDIVFHAFNLIGKIQNRCHGLGESRIGPMPLCPAHSLCASTPRKIMWRWNESEREIEREGEGEGEREQERERERVRERERDGAI